MIYLLDPTLTKVESPILFDFLKKELEKYSPISCITSEDICYGIRPGTSDAIVFANPHQDIEISEVVSNLLEDAKINGSIIVPVATNIDNRHPPAIVETIQSYDVVDFLKQRNLPSSNTNLIIVAQHLTWNILSRAQPTLTKNRLRLFLCHRREDGEGLARKIDQNLSSRHEYVFRDLVNIQNGEVAQTKIENELEKADILVFIDTPKAGESEWIQRELELALGRKIPIVWIKIENQISRAKLPTPPADNPHLVIRADQVDQIDINSISDRILSQAFVLAHEHVRTAQLTFARIRRSASQEGLSVGTLDQRQYIYAITKNIDSQTGYPCRPHTDIIQVFGHRPSNKDVDHLKQWLEENNYGPHARTCRAFDAAILLDPLPRTVSTPESEIVIDNSENFFYNLFTSKSSKQLPYSPTLLLLGTFPQEVSNQESIKQAIYTLSSTWLRKGGQIIFGGHPTFTPLITEVGRQLLGDRSKKYIKIYQSRYFATDATVYAFERLAQVVLTKSTKSQKTSLSNMRKQMITKEKINLVIAVGGRTNEDSKHLPGIDEEIQLASQIKLPVYLLGAPGGRAAELAVEHDKSGWKKLQNLFSVEKNV